ncbi:hypothetical protein RZS08_55270, partial [Arthrospira platensis SPKY1]|nr:hypothetical protein [Arthrospira platensis SPKY1]
VSAQGCVTDGHVSPDFTIPFSCVYQQTAPANGLGAGSQRTYLGFVENQSYTFFMNLNGANISCVQGQWLTPGETPIGASFPLGTSAATANSVTVPSGADRLLVT